MNYRSAKKWLVTTFIVVCLLAVSAGMSRLHSQSSTGEIQGTVAEQSGRSVQGANVAVISASRVERTVLTGSDGKFDIAGIPVGSYTIQISAPGFSTIERSVSVAAGSNTRLPIALSIASVSQEVTVEAEGRHFHRRPARARQVAARRRIGPHRDLQQLCLRVHLARDRLRGHHPGRARHRQLHHADGIGNGQAKIYFRGFVDDDYSMTWDGVPFNDSNDPSHHSWAYIPAAAIGHVDFDRSPGTASDIGPSNFGGTIHFFSPELSDEAHVRLEETYGSWNTNQILGDINSGAFLHGKAHFWLNCDYQSSDGYQTFSPKQDVAATAKFDYKFSDRTYLSVIGTNIIVDAFTNNDPTRRQLLHYGDNYLYDNTETNADFASTSTYYYDPQFWRFSVYHVASFFDIVSFNHDFGKNWKLTTKTYGYGYSNHQHYQNKTDQDLITDSVNTSLKYEVVGGTDQPGWVNTTTMTSPTPTGVDKLNQYARGGEIEDLSYATKWGVFRTGSWYELTNTLRYQIYTDPITWVDSPYVHDIKFHEHFLHHGRPALCRVPMGFDPGCDHHRRRQGCLLSHEPDSVRGRPYDRSLPASNRPPAQPLACGVALALAANCTATTQHAQNYNSILPSIEANYRLNPVASVYLQYGRGSIAPYSAVFDTKGAEVAVTPPPTIASPFRAVPWSS